MTALLHRLAVELLTGLALGAGTFIGFTAAATIFVGVVL